MIGGGPNCPDNPPVFAVCYSRQDAFMTDFVDLIHPRSTRYPGRLPHYNIESRTIAESQFGRNKSRFKGLTSVCAFQSRNIVVGHVASSAAEGRREEGASEQNTCEKREKSLVEVRHQGSKILLCVFVCLLERVYPVRGWVGFSVKIQTLTRKRTLIDC